MSLYRPPTCGGFSSLFDGWRALPIWPERTSAAHSLSKHIGCLGSAPRFWKDFFHEWKQQRNNHPTPVDHPLLARENPKPGAARNMCGLRLATTTYHTHLTLPKRAHKCDSFSCFANWSCLFRFEAIATMLEAIASHSRLEAIASGFEKHSVRPTASHLAYLRPGRATGPFPLLLWGVTIILLGGPPKEPPNKTTHIKQQKPIKQK